jgi:hypothetical protein
VRIAGATLKSVGAFGRRTLFIEKMFNPAGRVAIPKSGTGAIKWRVQKKTNRTSNATKLCGADVLAGCYGMIGSAFVAFAAAVIWRLSASEQGLRQTLIFCGSRLGKRLSPSAIPNKNMHADLAPDRWASTFPAIPDIPSASTISARHLRKSHCWASRSTARLPPNAGRL